MYLQNQSQKKVHNQRFDVGQEVTLTARFRSHVIGMEEYTESVHTGTVIKTPSYVEYGAVTLKTGNPDFPISIIPLRNVVGYEEPEFSGVKKAWNIGKYIVESINGQVSCTCVGFQYRRYCKHSDEIKAKSN